LKKADGCNIVVVVGDESMREYVESFDGQFILD